MSDFTIDMKGLETSIDRICELVDQLRAQRSLLLEACIKTLGTHSDDCPVCIEVGDVVTRVIAAIEEEAKL